MLKKTIDNNFLLLQKQLGYSFNKRKMLIQALTHRSYSKENNERLEFLGDSILNCIISEILYEKYNNLSEGDLSRLRSNLVKQSTLYEIAQKLQLSEFLLLSDGELKNGGCGRPSILADTLEAIIGAIFLESGFYIIKKIIYQLYKEILEKTNIHFIDKDSKTLLQEYLQSHQLLLPVYNITSTTGMSHSQVFKIECSVTALNVTVFEYGYSRQSAEQKAAKLALKAVKSILEMPKNNL